MVKKLPDFIANISFLKPRDCLAVDFGSSSIKVLSLKQAGDKQTLVKWGIIPLNDGGAELSPQDRKNLTEARLAEFLAKEKNPVKNIVSSLSGNQVIVRYVRFPKMSRDELMKTVQFEAEPYIPFDIREVDLSFHIIGDVVEEGQKKMETILVAVKKEVVQARLELLNALNLRPVVVDLDLFALQNAYELNTDPSVSETVLIVNVGAAVTNMSLVENRVSRVVRDVFISGNSFTKAIQRALSCDYKAAEEFKTKYGILVTAEEKEKTLAENQKEALQISTAVTPVAKELLGEIQRSIDFFISQNQERTVNRLVLCGGTSGLKNLDLYLNQGLKIPVEIFNPFKQIFGGESVPPEIASQFAVAVGLALRRENDIPKK